MMVYVLARPQLDWSSINRFASDHGLQFELDSNSDSEMLVEMCGRVCYMSYGKGRKTNREFCDHIISSGHHSVLEHANWTLLITGISRACSHELVRHRHFSFSQLSQRYVQHTKFVTPYTLPPSLENQWKDLMQRSKDLYDVLCDTNSGERKERLGMARSVLPNATETKLAVTGNARTWREFIQKRNTEHADQEIRSLAQECLKLLRQEAPNLFGDLS